MLKKIVATVLTACGIETFITVPFQHWFYSQLQQCLPLVVFKQLEQVLKQRTHQIKCCNSTYLYNIEQNITTQNPEQINLICSGFCLSYFEYVYPTACYIIMLQPMRVILIEVMIGCVLVILIKRFSVIGLYYECKLWLQNVRLSMKRNENLVLKL